MTNASDPKQVKIAVKLDRRTRIQELGDVEFLLQTASGRRHYWRLMEFCGVFELSHVRGDTHQTAFCEGQRNIGLKLLADLMEAAPHRWLEMREENFEEADDARVSDSSGDTEV